MAALALMTVLASCQKEEKAAAQPHPAGAHGYGGIAGGGEQVSLTGEIQPRYKADLGFRVNGKILERPVDVGTGVKKEGRSSRAPRPAAIPAGPRGREGRNCESGGRGGTEPGSGIPPARTAEKWPHHSSRV